MGAGSGTRFGSLKQAERIGGETLAGIACSVFLSNRAVGRVILTSPPGRDTEEFRVKASIPHEVDIIEGGQTRPESVLKALYASSAEYVLIHDAARAACRGELVDRVIKTMIEKGSAVPALNPVSTVKIMEVEGKLRRVDRGKVFIVQTPQGYRRRQILEAYERKSGADHTDSSSVAEEAGIHPCFVEGSPLNIKVTVPDDMVMLRAILREETCEPG